MMKLPPRPDRYLVGLMYLSDIRDFRKRKEVRTNLYMLWVYKWKLIKCRACAGSGRYDNTGSPKCSSCEGTGKE